MTVKSIWELIRSFKEDQVEVYVFILNGVRLGGVITCVCDDGVLLKRDGITQAIRAEAIATVMPVESL